MITNICGVELVLGQDTVEAGHSTLLFESNKIWVGLVIGLELINDLHGLDLVDLVEVTNASLHDLDEDEGLNNGVAGGLDHE